MFKAIREFFQGKAKDQSNIFIHEETNFKEDHLLDWIYEGLNIPNNQRFLKREDYGMVGEPVLTLISSLIKDRKRFDIERVTLCEYKKHVDSETIYGWMRDDHNVSFYKFTDTKSGVTKTIVISKGNLYRVDNVGFNLNAWESKALYLAFSKAFDRREARQRRQQMKASRAARERIAKNELDKIERLKYAEIFK